MPLKLVLKKSNQPAQTKKPSPKKSAALASKQGNGLLPRGVCIKLFKKASPEQGRPIKQKNLKNSHHASKKLLCLTLWLLCLLQMYSQTQCLHPPCQLTCLVLLSMPCQPCRSQSYLAHPCTPPSQLPISSGSWLKILLMAPLHYQCIHWQNHWANEKRSVQQMHLCQTGKWRLWPLPLYCK